MDRTPVGRIESLDLLRGLCAIGVACYHVMSWLGVATVHDLGLYGVYLFFLLSGASMTIAYARRFADGYPVTSYLALRYIRLAPLYVLAATYVALVDLRSLYTLPQLVGRWLLNVTFLFGLANPGDTSLIVGGWSLGIEFVYYLAFPLLLAVIATRRGLWVAVLLFCAQLIFVNLVIGGTQLALVWTAYSQFAAFIGYFAVGTWIGVARLDGRLTPLRAPWAWVAALVLATAIVTQSGATAEASLTGFRGAALALACCALLAVAIRLDLPRPLRRVASLVGDASYPMYLLHPIVFKIVGQFIGAQHRARFAAVVLVASFGLALAVYRWIEAPVMRWGKRRL